MNLRKKTNVPRKKIIPRKSFRKLLIVLYRELEDGMPNEDMTTVDFLLMARDKIDLYINHICTGINGIDRSKK